MPSNKLILLVAFVVSMLTSGGMFNYYLDHPSFTTINSTEISISPLCNVSNIVFPNFNTTVGDWLFIITTFLPLLPLALEICSLPLSLDHIMTIIEHNEHYFMVYAVGQTSCFGSSELATFLIEDANAIFWHKCQSNHCQQQLETLPLSVLCNNASHSYNELYKQLHTNPNLAQVLLGSSTILFIFYLYRSRHILWSIKLGVLGGLLVILILLLVQQHRLLLMSWSVLFQSFLYGVFVQCCVIILIFFHNKTNLKTDNLPLNPEVALHFNNVKKTERQHTRNREMQVIDRTDQ